MARSKPTTTTRSTRNDVAAAVPANGKHTPQKKRPKIISEEDRDLTNRQLSG
jgi:hypothetical protein